MKYKGAMGLQHLYIKKVGDFKRARGAPADASKFCQELSLKFSDCKVIWSDPIIKTVQVVQWIAQFFAQDESTRQRIAKYAF